MIVYNVRSRALLDIVNEMDSGRLVVAPYFQRNLVWRLIHKKDFIDTILKGFPFPQIFIARGKIDVQKMTATSCVVDGQQRLSAIREFVRDEFDVNGLKFSQMEVAPKEDFLKYQIAVIELDLKEDDPAIIEIFKRLNRTFYSLSSIEKFSTEFAASEFMITAKVLCKELLPDEDLEIGGPYDLDPNIPKDSIAWAKLQAPTHYQDLMLNGKVFSSYETQRLIHLMFTLNVMATAWDGFYNRNDAAKRMLEEFSQDFPAKDKLVADLDAVAKFINEMKLPEKSYWLNKANMFSLFNVLLTQPKEDLVVGPQVIRKRLLDFEGKIPPEYIAAAKEGVNNKRERIIRYELLQKNIF